MIIGAIEAGGTKFVCGVGNEKGEILERISFPTETPEITLAKVVEFFKDKNIERLGISNIDVQVYNALDKDDSLVGKADIVIADLPCSGLGIMGRKPDIRYNISPEKISDIIRLQRDILEVVSMYVKPGGTLVYSTCTINRSENEDNADWICTSLGFTRDGEYVQMLPSPDKDNDGFFVARLIKNS